MSQSLRRVVVLSPFERPDPELVPAAARAGALGVLDLGRDPRAARRAIDDLTPAAGILYDTWLSPLQADPGTFGGGTTRSFNGLADGSYTFHVVAKDGPGHLGADTTATFSVAIPPGPPPAPSPASAAAIGARVVRVSWANVAGETSYSIERCLLSGRQCSYGALASGLAADTTSFDDTVAANAPAGAYAYRVQACNGTGCSGWAPTNAVNVP